MRRRRSRGRRRRRHALDGSDANAHISFPRARYLSQQFVDELCSAKGVSDGLVDEIGRVIFELHSQDDREWAMDFAELREQQTSRFKQAREREADAVAYISERIATELEKERLVATLTTQVGQKKKLIEAYTADRAKLVVKGCDVLPKNGRVPACCICRKTKANRMKASPNSCNYFAEAIEAQSLADLAAHRLNAGSGPSRDARCSTNEIKLARGRTAMIGPRVSITF